MSLGRRQFLLSTVSWGALMCHHYTAMRPVIVRGVPGVVPRVPR